jgi:hypothetical protein
MKKITLLFLVGFFVACNNNADNNSVEQDTTAMEVEEVAEERPELEQAKVSFQQLFSFYEKNDSSFQENNFNLVMMDSMQLLAPQPIDEISLKPYYPYLIYNSDSLKAIDLYSYNVMLSQKGGQTIANASGPDTEIAVVDFKNKTRQRLLYVGPSFTIQDGKWINDHVLSLIGGEIIEEGKFSPSIWLMDLDKKTMQVLDYADTLNVRYSAYQNSRIPLR